MTVETFRTLYPAAPREPWSDGVVEAAPDFHRSSPDAFFWLGLGAIALAVFCAIPLGIELGVLRSAVRESVLSAEPIPRLVVAHAVRRLVPVLVFGCAGLVLLGQFVRSWRRGR